MGLIDKILLLLLVLLMPLGLLFARQLSIEPTEEGLSDEEKLARVEELLGKVGQNKLTLPEEPTALETIQIDSVTVSSDSALLRVVGKAPDTQAAIYVDLSIIPDSVSGFANNMAVSDPAALGWPVERYAVLPKATGDFVFEYVMRDDLGTLTIQLTQLEAAGAVQYDLTSQTVKE